MEVHYKDGKVSMEHNQIPIEKTAIVLDEEKTDNQQRAMSQNIELNNDSTHIFDRPHSNISGGETLGQSQVTKPMADSGNPSDNSTAKNCRFLEIINEEPSLITTNIINHSKEDLGPIVEYAEEPLLSLFQACAPLTSILHNLSYYVQMAIYGTPERPPDGLTIDESAAIRLYTIEWERPHRSLYVMLNQTLMYEQREHLRPYFKYMKLFLTALAKLPCVPPLTVWRGVTKNVSAEFPRGTPVTLWAFSSCTTELAVLRNNTYLSNAANRTLFSVEAINGRAIRAHSHFLIEDEIVLLPGTHMIVQSHITPAPDLHIIHLQQVIPKQVLLKPPFEGIAHIVNELFYYYNISIFRCSPLSRN
jgi:hypothetical protein